MHTRDLEGVEGSHWMPNCDRIGSCIGPHRVGPIGPRKTNDCRQSTPAITLLYPPLRPRFFSRVLSWQGAGFRAQQALLSQRGVCPAAREERQACQGLRRCRRSAPNALPHPLPSSMAPAPGWGVRSLRCWPESSPSGYGGPLARPTPCPSSSLPPLRWRSRDRETSSAISRVLLTRYRVASSCLSRGIAIRARRGASARSGPQGLRSLVSPWRKSRGSQRPLGFLWNSPCLRRRCCRGARYSGVGATSPSTQGGSKQPRPPPGPGFLGIVP